ncbi:MAG: family 16 glycoside hydrolase, partial [Planctomycetia bacterium]
MIRACLTTGVCLALAVLPPATPAAAEPAPPKAFIDGVGPGWVELGEKDFATVNGDPDTWTFKEDGLIVCKGTPVGVTQSTKTYKNLELVVEWRHLKSAGNSGVFLWATKEALTGLKPGQLPPGGIEVQILDH